ncbi:class I SAM-dependent methyltransferase [Rhizobium rhizogenes]|uniref:class I SAM-dependent DNA methyltransferase n=1 Tax=Rhizobium rhizogenes TaxID=359 RepID=UPI0022C82BD7|nr:class I SAM-dependent methyltransferase [Rhizobium rhizogenes]MCZ7486922.1 class I SAM-dependent methyltransferase [Rhizobium rhizogenes]
MSTVISSEAGNYDHWAWLYNHTLGPRYSEQKIEPLARAVLSQLPDGASVLDLCCGTGHLAKLMAARGYAVTGLDGSQDMINHARGNAPDLEFVLGDARDFTFEHPFDGVVCTSASLNHIQNTEDLQKVFSSVRRCLKDDGIFAFDINHPGQMVRYWRDVPAEGELTDDYAWLITPRYNPRSNEGSFTVEIHTRSKEAGFSPVEAAYRLAARLLSNRRRLALIARFGIPGKNWQRHSVTNPVWGHNLETVTELLRASGFSVKMRSTDGGPVTDERAVYFLCTKIAGDSAGQEVTQEAVE